MAGPVTPETRAQLIEDGAAAQYNAVWGGGSGGITNGSWATASPADREPYLRSAERMLTAFLAHRESIVCPTCEGTGKGQSRYGSRWIIGGDPCHCTDGVILGPTVLVERAEYEQVGWYSESGNFWRTRSADAATGKDVPVFVLRSSNQKETP